jgi:hypothetical protein
VTFGAYIIQMSKKKSAAELYNQNTLRFKAANIKKEKTG